MHNLRIKELLNIDGINPENSVGRCHFDIKRHKLMIWGVVNTLLNSTGSLDILCMIGWPESSQVLSIDLDDFNFRVSILDLVENMIKVVVNLSNKISGVKEALSEIIPRLFARNRDLVRKEIGPSAIPCDLVSAIIVD
jgi:hypothetical protein